MYNSNKNQCPRCSKTFSSQQRLQSHLESQIECHIKMMKLICPFCQKKFSRKFNLDKHLEKHLEKHQDQSIKPIFPIKLKLKNDHNSFEKQIAKLIEKQTAEQK